MSEKIIPKKWFPEVVRSTLLVALPDLSQKTIDTIPRKALLWIRCRDQSYPFVLGQEEVTLLKEQILDHFIEY